MMVKVFVNPTTLLLSATPVRLLEMQNLRSPPTQTGPLGGLRAQ